MKEKKRFSLYQFREVKTVCKPGQTSHYQQDERKGQKGQEEQGVQNEQNKMRGQTLVSKLGEEKLVDVEKIYQQKLSLSRYPSALL